MGNRSASSRAFKQRLFNNRAVRASDDAIRNRDNEHLVVIDPTGNIVYTGTGDRNSVDLPDDPRVLRDSTTTHNHPDDTTFSADDIELMVRYNIKSLRAVTSDGAYVLDRQFKIDRQTRMDFYKAYRANDKALRKELNEMKRFTKQERKANRISQEEYDQAMQYIAYRWDNDAHEWLKKNASDYGYLYKKERR